MNVPQLKISKILIYCLVLLTFYQSLTPAITLAESVIKMNKEIENLELLVSDSDLSTSKISVENKKYKDPNVKKVENQINEELVEPEFENGTGNNPFEKLSSVDEIVKEKPNKKGVNIKNIKEKSVKDVSKQGNLKSEFVGEDSVRILEQKFKNKFDNSKIEVVEVEYENKKETEYKVENKDFNIYFKNINTNGVLINSTSGDLTFKAKNSNSASPKLEEGAIIYKNVWDGVDVVYELEENFIKEYIVINKHVDNTIFEFETSGATLVNSPKVKGGIDIKIGEANMYIEPLLVIAKEIGPVTQEIVTQEVGENNTIKISLDNKWLKNLSNNNFPVSIDPGVIWGERQVDNGNTSYRSYKTGGYTCDYVYCDLNVGGLIDNGQQSWRSVLSTDFSELQGKTFLGAYIELNMSTKSYRWNGFYNTNATIWATWANCWGYSCNNSGAPVVSSNMTSSGTIDLTSVIRWMIDNNRWDGDIILWGEENRGDSFKAFDASNFYLNYAYNYIPNNNATVAYPQNNSVVTNANQILKINPATDPDNDTLEYDFVLSDSTGNVVQRSTYTGGVSMPIVDGVLQDGITYTWRVYVKDSYYQHSDPAFTSTFKVNFRTGKDTTQSYDEAGPIAVNYATGNSYTSNSSHSMAALGGNIGIGIEYNSPLLTKEGLSAKYWNNTTMTGDPVYTRIDSNIDFDWNLSSPFKGIVSVDNFSASWSGYFIAPQSGNYKFGTEADDTIKFYGGGNLLYQSTCCDANWTTNSVSLTEGQAWPIKIDFTEFGGGARVKFNMELPTGERKLVTSENLRTAPVFTGLNRGLTGKYYLDDGTHDFSKNNQRFLMRNEPIISFDWAGSPIEGGPENNFLVKYEGYVTVPITGTYKFGTVSDDGVKVKLNNSYIIQNWTDHSSTENWSTGINLAAGTLNKIVIEYYEKDAGANLSLKWDGPAGIGIIENKYLSPEANILPTGWNLTLDASGSIPFESLKVRPNNDIVMISSNGTESLYAYNSAGYKPPINEDGWLVKNADNTYTFTDTVGTIYVYDALDNSGNYKLKQSSTPYDDKNPAALKYEYSDVGGSPRLRKIIDSVDPSRYGQLYYRGDAECINGGGDNAIPFGYLCGFYTSDGRWTRFFYYKGFLNQIEYPGQAYYEYGSYTDGRIATVRDIPMVDAVKAGLRVSSETGASFRLVYDELGRATTLSLPSNSGPTIIKHSFEYLPRSSKQHIIGATEPKGYSKYIEFDTLFRTTKVCDNMALCSTSEWDANKDLILSTTSPTGLKSTIIYDADDRPVERFGPAPQNWFGSDRKPLLAYINQVPRTETKYDENFVGGSIAYYQVKGSTLFGSPNLHTFGLNNSDKSVMNFDSTTQTFPINKETGMDGVGLSITGKITFPQNGTYQFKLNQTDGARLFIDDKLIANSWANRSTTPFQRTANFVAEANKVYRVRIDWITFNSTKYFNASLAGPGITETNRWNNFIPGYNLPTTNIAYDQQLGNIETKTNYQDPAYGLVSTRILDPSGLNYSSSVTFEAPETGYFRKLSKTSPGGSLTQYTYYGTTETRDNPCTPAVDAVSQAGFVKSKIEPDPDLNGSQTSITNEVVYDSSGRVVASKINNEAWNCTTYDARGRVQSKLIATNNGKVGKTITNNFAYGGNPLRKLMTDGATTLISEFDYVGNLIKYTDSQGSITTYTYDNLSRLTKKISEVGTEEWTYDDYSQVISKLLNSIVYANVTYDNLGRISTILYPQSGQLSYLGTTRDALERPIKYNWKQSDGTLLSEELTRSQSGLVLSQKFTQASNVYNQSYTFDKADRLIAADYGDRQFAYSYSQPLGCTFTNSHKNFNRTSDSVTVGGTTTTNNYCYDNADKLVSSTQYGSPTYDSHGNTTKLGNVNFEYDVSDNNISVTEGVKKITYQRDVVGRIINSNFNNSSEVKNYNFTNSSTSPSILKDGNNNIVERYVSLPGLILTIKNSIPEYSIMTSTGNVLANNTGTLKRYDPFGVQISGGNIYGFGGSELRETEKRFSIEFIQMGARVYIPTLGRFLQVDPIKGGTQNDYVYPTDPINANDFSGKFERLIVALLGSTMLHWVFAAVSLLYIASKVLPTLGKGSEATITALNSAINTVGDTVSKLGKRASEEKKEEIEDQSDKGLPRPELKHPKDKLPTDGDYPYRAKPDKGMEPGDVKLAPGRGNQDKGYLDENGRIWEWDKMHNDHWDVNYPDGSRFGKVYPDGRTVFF